FEVSDGFCFPVSRFIVRGLMQKANRQKWIVWGSFILVACSLFCGCASRSLQMKHGFQDYILDYDSPIDPALQTRLEGIDSELRTGFGMSADQTAVGLLDLRTARLAMIHPDRGEYAASVPKIGILLAYFQLHPEAATNLNPQTRHELGLMIKASNNEM